MKKNLFKSALTGLTLFAFLFALTPSSLAIGIRPIRSEFSVAPGESVTGELTVLNETEVDFKAGPVIKVFYKNDETGFPVYPTEEELNETENFRDWIEISEEPVFIAAGESATVKYKVNVPKEATAGGKYATIAYQPIKNPNGGVAVNVRAASLLFVNVEGDVIKEGKINRFALPEALKNDEPFKLEVTFENTGNTHIKPYGWIEIKDKKTGEKLTQISRYIEEETGKEIIDDKIPVNLRKKNVLPGSTRTFQAEWTDGIREGEFEALVQLRYGDESASVSQSMDFQIKEELSVDDFIINTQEDSADFDLTLTNKGNAGQKPIGAIKITNNLGYQVAEVPFPEMEALAPGETVKLNLPWLKKAIPAGRYTATIDATYGFTQKALTGEVVFGQLDKTKLWMGIGLGIAILIALGSLLRRRKKRK